MPTVTKPDLRKTTEEDTDRLARLEAQGLVILPRNEPASRFRVRVPARGKPAFEMVVEDRR